MVSGSKINKPDHLPPGNPAIFKRPVAFRPHLTIGLALSIRGFKLPTGKLCQLGAGHIQFEAFSHGVTSWIEVEWLVG